MAAILTSFFWILDHNAGFFAIRKYGAKWQPAVYLDKLWSNFDEILRRWRVAQGQISRILETIWFNIRIQDSGMGIRMHTVCSVHQVEAHLFSTEVCAVPALIF